MDLKEYCDSLSRNALLRLAASVCESGLFIWDKYASENSLSYRETVVGTHHNVRPQLLYDSIRFIKNNVDQPFIDVQYVNELLYEFLDPIVSLQDADWELPYPVEHIFYSVYNLLKGLSNEKTIFKENAHYVCINQAVDAMTEDGSLSITEIKQIIYPDLH